MNKYIKDLCELCGFNTPITKVCYRAGARVEETFPKYELVGTHAGRRTFICFALIEKTVNETFAIVERRYGSMEELQI